MNLTFGVGISTSAEVSNDPVAQALHAETLGFDFVSASDHPCGTNPSHETWTMLVWIAARTTRIKMATRVLGVPYRPPAIVAKMAQTLDALSGGRLILGLGGGYSDDEFRAFGLTVPSPAEKVAGLADAIAIARGLWNEDSFTYSGRIYHTEAATVSPKPTNHIPIWLGTFGPKALEVTGRLADGWIPSHGYMPDEEVPAMRDRIFESAVAAGRSTDDITLAYNLDVRVGDSLADPNIFSGPAEAIVERLLRYVELGFTTFNFIAQEPADRQQVELLATQVMPQLRAAAN